MTDNEFKVFYNLNNNDNGLVLRYNSVDDIIGDMIPYVAIEFEASKKHLVEEIMDELEEFFMDLYYEKTGLCIANSESYFIAGNILFFYKEGCSEVFRVLDGCDVEFFPLAGFPYHDEEDFDIHAGDCNE